MIPKGVPLEDPTKYCPIALLNGMYKILDAILKDRFTAVIDPNISRK